MLPLDHAVGIHQEGFRCAVDTPVDGCAAILVGSLVGLLIRGGLPKRFEETIFQAVGLAVVFIGLGGALSGLLKLSDGALTTQYTMLMVLSLVCLRLMTQSVLPMAPLMARTPSPS